MTNLFIFKTVDQFSAFIHEVNTLKNLVRCPICEELVENPLCGSCNHIFCSQCITDDSNKCPICKKVTTPIPINDHIKSLLNWLQNVDIKLKSTFNCDVLSVNNNNEIKAIFNDYLSKDTVGSSSSISTFDKLFDSDLQNHLIKKKSIKKYSKKTVNKQSKQKNLDSVTLHNNILPKNELKRDVFKWLDSTKNTFDRLLTQTQYTIDEDSTQDSINLPSVSQVNSKTTQKNQSKRSRSFETKPNSHMELRRFSNQELKDKSQVDHSNTECVVRLLEEEYLDRIEMDINKKNKNSNNNKSGWKRMKKINTSANKNKGKIKELDVTLTSPSDNKENVKKNLNPRVILNLNNLEKSIEICTKKRKLNDNSFDTSLNCKKSVNHQNTQTSSVYTISASVQTEMYQQTNEKISKKIQTREIQTQTDSDDLSFGKKVNELKTGINASVQTINFENNRYFCSIQIQTDNDDFEIKTQPINNSNNRNDEHLINKSPLVPTQKLNKEINIETSCQSSRNSDLIISLTNPNINSKEECEDRIANMLKNYKRIHADYGEDDNDLNVSKPIDANKKKIENRYLKEDLSIEMISENILSENENEVSLNSGKDLANLNDGNEVDYDRYLVNIMKKYEEKKVANPSNNKPSTSNKKSESQNVYEKCDAMIKSIVNKTETDKKVNIVNNENRVKVDLEIIEEFDKSFNEKTLSKTSNTLPCTEALMENIDIEELERSFILKENSRLKDKEKDVKNIEEEEKRCNVVILKNISINQGKGKESIVEEDDRVSVHSEDLFNNLDNDKDFDEDVIEDSPKKSTTNHLVRRSFPELKKGLFKKQEIQLPLPLDSPNIISSAHPSSFLDQTFTPPADFQDTTEHPKDTIEHDAQTSLIINNSNSNDFIENIVPSDVMDKGPPSNDKKNNVEIVDLCSINYNDFEEPMSFQKNNKINNNEDSDKKNKNNEMDLSISESELLQLLETQKTTTLTNNKCSQNFDSSNIITSTQKSFNKKRFESLEISPIRSEKRKRNSLDLVNKSTSSPLSITISQKPESSEYRFLSMRKQKSILSFVKPDKIDKNETIVSIASSPSSSHSQSPYVCCTRLNKEQMKLVIKLTKSKLIKYSNNFAPNITHIICATTENNCIYDHTMKLLKAIAYGKWVVNVKWIEDCLRKNQILPETDYEALDMSGEPGPKISRLQLHEKLLKGFKIYLEPPFVSASKEEIEELISILEGEVVPSLRDLFEVNGIRLIIAESNGTQDCYKFEEWCRKYKVFVVDIEWLSRSIGQYKLVSLRPFGLCSDDNIHQLGYPTDLTIEASFSYSQNAIAINK